MRAVEYIGKAEGIRSREKGAEARIEQLSQSIDRLSRRKRVLQEEIRQLSQEEDGLEDNLSELEAELADIQQDIAEKQGQKELAQQELHDAVEERQATLFEIQEAARVHSRDLSGASNLFGSFAQIGSNLSMAFQGALGSLSQAASILGGSIDSQEGRSGGGRGSHSGFTPGISGGTADEGNPYASRQISGARTLLGHFSSALVKILPTFSSSQLSSQDIPVQSARPSSGKSESSFVSAQTSGFTQTPNNFTTSLPLQKYMTTEEGRVCTDDNGKIHIKFLSSYEERLDKTPSPERDSGHWTETGKRGECMFIPDDVPKTQRVRDALSRYGLEGIEYRNAVPDFSKCSEATVQIDNMRGNDVPRTRNYEQCDAACAKQWNDARRDGRTDWTARDVQNWRDNGTDIKYTWHERNDMTTCDMVPTEINRYFSHLGGCAECDRRDAIDKESAFDD